jgi:hypothetical protein
MLDQSAANTGRHPRQALVDAGYCSETNLEAAKERQLACDTDTFVATGRLAHGEQVRPAPRGRIPSSATLKERMTRKLRTKPGRAAEVSPGTWTQGFTRRVRVDPFAACTTREGRHAFGYSALR